MYIIHLFRYSIFKYEKIYNFKEMGIFIFDVFVEMTLRDESCDYLWII